MPSDFPSGLESVEDLLVVVSAACRWLGHRLGNLRSHVFCNRLHRSVRNGSRQRIRVLDRANLASNVVSIDRALLDVGHKRHDHIGLLLGLRRFLRLGRQSLNHA